MRKNELFSNSEKTRKYHKIMRETEVQKKERGKTLQRCASYASHHSNGKTSTLNMNYSYSSPKIFNAIWMNFQIILSNPAGIFDFCNQIKDFMSVLLLLLLPPFSLVFPPLPPPPSKTPTFSWD